MSDFKTAAQQVLDYWERAGWGDAVMVDKMDALRAALAQQAEPVTLYSVDQPLNYMTRCADGTEFINTVVMPAHAVSWAYTTPPQRKPLSEEEVDKIFRHLCNTVGASYKTMTRAVERAHGIGGQP